MLKSTIYLYSIFSATIISKYIRNLYKVRDVKSRFMLHLYFIRVDRGYLCLNLKIPFLFNIFSLFEEKYFYND